jgi:hypothetical protein
MKFGCLWPAILLGSVAVSLSYAQHTDVEIEVIDGTLVVESNIAEGEFGEDPNPPNVADEPGFEVDDGNMVAGDELSFNAVDVLGKNLWYWDGADITNVDFQDSPHDLAIEHPVVNTSVTLSSASSGGVAGFLIDMADSEGGLHQDLEFVLDTDPPANGVYLFGLELASDAYASSEPVYFVMASGVEEAVHEAAVDWTNTTFNIPEPIGPMWLAGGLILTILRIRRSRQTRRLATCAVYHLKRDRSYPAAFLFMLTLGRVTGICR